ncbi:MAG: thiosulfate dehydrogenase (quinone) large subunit [Actinomycetota bacterium]|jgi:thiosulfate dehydrogenase [quinone] large subunit|nr:thiosulfate dehydrogenase (quinone) large subunit [Actinomycetota bacterium]
MSVAESLPAAVVRSWRRQPVYLRLLRTFLGVTFVYAGAQKLADPGYFKPGAPTYIGTQLKGFAQGSPIGPLLRILAHVAVPVGWIIALGEVAVGVATLLGIGVMIAAAVGFVINVALLLSATWHVHPYFLGSDSIYAVAWLVYLLALVDRKETVPTPRRTSNRRPQPTSDRREFLRAGAVAIGTILVSSVSRAAAGKSVARSANGNLGNASGHSKPGATQSPSGSASSSAPQVSGQPIADLDSLKVGSPIAFSDHGTPAVLFRTGSDSVEAFSRVCTHAGCTVGFNPQTGLLQCPCHGATFDPSRNAAVVAGPAPTPLPVIKVAVDPATRKVMLQG